MTKKLLLLLAVFMLGAVTMFAQNPVISILGGSTTVGWSGDLDMATTDGVTYTYSNLVVTVPSSDPGVKFRQGHDWGTNWGSTAFPSGTATPNGANIPATNGTYNVTFNRTSGAFSFVPVGVTYDVVVLVGGGATLTLSTSDGVNYHSNGVALQEGAYHFNINGTGQYGGTGFPSGTAMNPGSITVPANTYNITYSTETDVYNFGFVTISAIGGGVVNWDTDVDFATTDGVNYMIASQVFVGGEMKFRQNHNWDLSWGSGIFPSGTLVSPGENFTVPAGTYRVMFNRTTAEFSMSDVAGVTTVVKNNVSVYPNPSATSWNFSTTGATLTNVKVTDITGKTVINQAVNGQIANVNATALSAGVYFASVTANGATTVLRVVKN
jgi:hypothetical protein